MLALRLPFPASSSPYLTLLTSLASGVSRMESLQSRQYAHPRHGFSFPDRLENSMAIFNLPSFSFQIFHFSRPTVIDQVVLTGSWHGCFRPLGRGLSVSWVLPTEDQGSLSGGALSGDVRDRVRRNDRRPSGGQYLRALSRNSVSTKKCLSRTPAI